MSPSPASYSHRLWIYGPVIALALLVAAYSAYWHVGENTWAARLDGANGGEVMPGVTFAFAAKEISGFPFRLDTVLEGVTLSHRTPEGETALRIERLAMHSLSYRSGHYVLETDGLVSLARPGAGGQPNVLYITPAQTRASAILKDDALIRFDLDMAGFAARDARAEESGERNVTAKRLQIHALHRDAKTVEFLVKADGMEVGAGYEFPLDRKQTVFAISGKILDAQVFDGVRKGQSDFDAAVQEWRKAGGEMSLALEAQRDGKSLALTGTAQANDAGDLTGSLHGGGGGTLHLAHGELSPE